MVELLSREGRHCNARILREENQFWRVEECQEYAFDRNGADELVELVLGMST